jgi:hypothetical protein
MGLSPSQLYRTLAITGWMRKKMQHGKKKLNWRLEQTGSDEYFYEITPTNVVAPPTGAPTFTPAGARC